MRKTRGSHLPTCANLPSATLHRSPRRESPTWAPTADDCGSGSPGNRLARSVAARDHWLLWAPVTTCLTPSPTPVPTGSLGPWETCLPCARPGCHFTSRKVKTHQHPPQGLVPLPSEHGASVRKCLCIVCTFSFLYIRLPRVRMPFWLESHCPSRGQSPLRTAKGPGLPAPGSTTPLQRARNTAGGDMPAFIIPGPGD